MSIDLNSMNIAEVCRVCANKIKDKKSQRHLFSHRRGHLLNQLKLITGVELTLDNDDVNGLPKFICERCQSELDLAVKFRERCIFSQRYLKDMLKKKRGEADDTDFDMTEEQMIDLDDEQFMFKEGVFIEPDQIYVEEDMQSLAGWQQEKDDSYEEDMDPQASVMAAAEAAYVANLQEQQNNQNVNGRQKFFICDECGHLSVNAHSYGEHLRAHAERKTMKQFFPCSNCHKTFTTKAKLKHHRQQSHCSLRIFKCSTCKDTFAAFGDKQRHEKIHANERPYPCLECEMVFHSIGQLKIHAASHCRISVSPPPNSRRHKYRCEPCGREFSLRLHLSVHNKGKAHKRMLRKRRIDIEALCEN